MRSRAHWYGNENNQQINYLVADINVIARIIKWKRNKKEKLV